MNVIPTSLPDVLIIEPDVFEDSRGFFFEAFNQQIFTHATHLDVTFVQDNHSRSRKDVLRGLHYQVVHPQGKLVRVTEGEILDVAVDLRRSSPTFGEWCATRLSAQNKRQQWIPPGFGHGFLVLSESADMLYKTTEYRHQQYERCIRWNDLALSINWPIAHIPILSQQDQIGNSLELAEVFP